MRLLVFAMLLLLAGCSVGPKYRRPTAGAPPAFKEHGPLETDEWKTAHPNEGELKGNWWELFGDPQLNALEAKVSISNQNVLQAEAQFRQARALVASNRANYFPSIGVSPSITSGSRGGSSNLNPSGVVTSNGSKQYSQFNLPFGVSWEPDLWGRVRLSVESASASAQSFAANLENLRLSAQAELATDYFLLRSIDAEEKILASTITEYERALQLTQNRFQGGVSSRADIVQAQSQLETTRALATDLGVARAQYEHAIAVLTGEAPASLTIEQGDLIGNPPPVPVALPSQLLERRPDIAAAERRVAAANAEIGLAQTAYYPNLSLTGSAGFASSSITNWFAWPSRIWSVGPALSQTLFDFGRRRAEVRISEAAYDATVAAYRQTVLTALQEVEDNLAALRILERESLEQQSAYSAAQESLQLINVQYKAGTVSYLNVIQAQAIALSSQRALVNVLRDRMTATVQLIRYLGGGWNASQLPTAADLRK